MPDPGPYGERAPTLRCVLFGHKWREPRTGLPVDRYYPSAMSALPGLPVCCARCGTTARLGYSDGSQP